MAEAGLRLPVERQVEALEPAFEVEVELAARLVQLGGASSTRGETFRASSRSSSSASWLGNPSRTRPRGVCASSRVPKGESVVV